MLPTELEISVINNITTRFRTYLVFVRDKSYITMDVLAARNGIIAFLHDNGWEDHEIAEYLKQDYQYVKNVTIHHHVAQLAKAQEAQKW